MSIAGRQITQIADERRRQDERWGVQNHSPERWATILAEECGEVAQAALHAERLNVLQARGQVDRLEHEKARTGRENLRTELVQVAAVCVAALEQMDREDRHS